MDQVRVRLDDGSEFELRELNGDNPFILIFLRHYGCIFCRYQVAQLRPAADLPIYFVGMGSVEETSRFRSRMRSPHRFISDPERTLYKRFGVPRATAGQVFNLRAVGAGVRATLSGQFQGRATSDPMQLGAAFILDGGGNVRWSLVPNDVSEIVGANTLREHLARVGQLISAVAGKNDPSGDHPPSGD